MSITGPELARIRDRVGDLEAFAGIRLVTLGDGHERGVRMLEVRSGSGLEFDIIIDRGFDIGRLTLHGRSFSWHSPTGFRAPWLFSSTSDRGQGFLRGFSGFLVTCGFDHIRQPETAQVADNDLYPGRAIDYPLHGHGTYQPGRLLGYGIDETADSPVVWCDGETRTAMVFGDCLALRRRISCPIGGNEILLTDRVTNIGASPSPHMILYHVNAGFPLLDIGTQISIGPARKIWESVPHDPFSPFPPPSDTDSSELSVHEFLRSADFAQCQVVNSRTGATLSMELNPRELPFCQVLRVARKRLYAAALEPCSSGHRNREQAHDHGEIVRLCPGETRSYSIRFVFDQAAAISPDTSHTQ